MANPPAQRCTSITEPPGQVSRAKCPSLVQSAVMRSMALSAHLPWSGSRVFGSVAHRASLRRSDRHLNPREQEKWEARVVRPVEYLEGQWKHVHLVL